MVYLLTGCAGFIASRVAALLLSSGHTVIGVDNLNNAYDLRLKQWRLAKLQGTPGFECHQFNIGDQAQLSSLRAGMERRNLKPDAVINLAARAGVRQSVENPWVYIDTNVTGTLNLLELCRQWEIKKFVLASTSSLYGAKNPLPFQESANTDGPLSPYAASKKAAEGLCYTYHYLYGIDVSIPRYFTVYGPAGRPDMSLFRFVQWIAEGRPVVVYGDGKQSRDFTYVEDIARGTVATLRPIGYETINLGSDKPVVLMNAIRILEELLGKKARIEYRPMHPADVPATWADISKAEKLLSWRPQIGIEQGLAELVGWYQENRGWARELVTAA